MSTSRPVTITFGKYRGKPLGEVPGGYLRWLVTPGDDGEIPCRSAWMVNEIESELERREGEGPAPPDPARDTASRDVPAASHGSGRGFQPHYKAPAGSDRWMNRSEEARQLDALAAQVNRLEAMLETIMERLGLKQVPTGEDTPY